MKSKIVLILIFIVFFITQINLVYASQLFIEDKYDVSNRDNSQALDDVYPGNTGARGQTFTCNFTGVLETAVFSLAKVGNPTGQAEARLYASTGTLPTGTALDTSDSLDVSTLAAGFALFTFNFTNGYELQNGVEYCIVIVQTSGVLSGANYVSVGMDVTAPSHSGNAFQNNGAAWAVSAGVDRIFYVRARPIYEYVFTDTYFENGNVTASINVTATGAGFDDEFNVTGGYTYLPGNEPVLFYWSIGGGSTRRIYTRSGVLENFTVTLPDADFDTYVFTVRDFTNKLSQGEAFLEAYRIVNGTNTLIERQKIDIHNEVPLNLVIGATYTIRVRFYDGSYYDWGTFVPGESTTFTIVLRGVAFTDQAYQVANFIFVEITRPTGTTFTIDYEATKNQTIWANVTIMIRNGAIVSQISRTNNSFVYNYAGAVANTSYIVLVEGVHTLRRTWGYTRIFDATETYPNVPDMETIFPMGNMDTTSLIGWVLTIASGLTFSLVYRKAALLAMGTVGALVTVFGFTDWSYYLLAFVWFFGVIVYLGSGEKG